MSLVSWQYISNASSPSEIEKAVLGCFLFRTPTFILRLEEQLDKNSDTGET